MKYIASWSGGKDSTVSIILAHEHGEPLDLIIFSEVMFDEAISGELPGHIDFIRTKAIPIFENWGYEVIILRSDVTYMSLFMGCHTRGKRKDAGLRRGFPMIGRCGLNKPCKVEPIKKYLKQMPEEIVQYIGIAIDEPTRMNRMKGAVNKMSLLEKYSYTEQMALDLCKKYDLLSPIYDFAPRGGCWFCPNASIKILRYLRRYHKDLWNRLIQLEKQPNLIGYKWNTLTDLSLKELDERFYWEDQQMNIFDFMDERSYEE